MGFMDKMKAAAQDIATDAKKATSSAQSKFEQGQTRKKIDDLAKQLGYLYYREKSQGTPAGSDADKLIADITALEDQLAQSQAASSEGPAQSTDAAPADPAAPSSETTT